MADDKCLNCGRTVRRIRFALGEQWMHVDVNSSFPSELKGTMWRHCKQTVATPAPDAVPSGEATDGTTPTKEA